MSDKRERRAAYEYTKSLNKPGRVGSFAEEERNRKVDERQEKQTKTKRVVMVGEPGPVKIPGAMLLILIGLVVLWLATTGQLDRLGKAWSYVLGHADLPSGAGTPPVKPASATATLLDTPSYHVANILADSDAPGGMY